MGLRSARIGTGLLVAGAFAAAALTPVMAAQMELASAPAGASTAVIALGAGSHGAAAVSPRRQGVRSAAASGTRGGGSEIGRVAAGAGSEAGRRGQALTSVTVTDPTDTGKCDGKMSGTYGAGKCQHGYVSAGVDSYYNVQVRACNGNPSALPGGTPAPQPYGYVYVDSSGKHTPGDYGKQGPAGGYFGANNNQSQSGPGAAPCDDQP